MQTGLKYDMINRFKKYMVALAGGFCLTPAYATDLTGRVLDAVTRQPVAGATVLVKNTSTGVSADGEGNFTLRTDAPLPVTLSINLLGYVAQEVVVTDAGENITVWLAESVSYLNEVVVVGYGTQRRRELTGAVASVAKQTLEQPSVSINELLSGSVAGLNVTQASGQPGAGSAIRIRGGNSVNASNEPLYVIDGVIVYPRSTNVGAGGTETAVESSIDPLASINPADIESISVLKDVSATAIYGSRGANGVILVTTKKGNRGSDIINYTVTAGWSTPAKRLKLLDAQQWGKLQREYFGNRGNLTDDYLASIGKGYDWQDAVLQTGFSQNHNLSVSGGGEKTRYSVSGNYTGQDGIIINSGFRRYSLRVNVDRNVRENLTVGATATFGKSTQNSLTTSKEVNYNSSPFGDGITNSLTYALFMPPTVPIYNEDGSYNYQNPWESSHFSLNGHQANPVSDLETSVAESINYSLLANFYASYEILNGLVAKVTLSTDRGSITQNFFAPSTSALGLNEVGVGSIGRKDHEIWQGDATLDYSKHFNDRHFIHLMGGYTWQNMQEDYIINRASHFTSEKKKHKDLAAGEVQTPTDNSYPGGSQLHAVIGRINYTLFRKYNLTANFRADYSSRFAPGKRWGYFPSAGFAWNIDEESFLKNNRVLNTLKLRLSTGKVGNTEIADFLWSPIYGTKRYNGLPVYEMINVGNSNLTWETTTEYNAGIDAGLFADRLSFTLDVYNKNTFDLLFEKPTPLGSPVDKQIVNIGNVNNKGVELAASVVLMRHKKLNWHVSANIARNINTITDLGDDNNLLSGQYSEQILRVGESLGSFYGLIFDGVVQLGEDVSKLPKVGGATPQPGDIKFVDAHEDGSIDLNDRVVLGSIHPDFTYGLSSWLAYGDFDLFVSFQGSQGNKMVNSLRRYLERAGSSYNVSAALLDAWTPENPSNEVPQVTQGYQLKYINSRHVEDASYLRLKNITLGYTLRLKTLSTDIRIFASAQNLFTLTKYKGYDPEVAGGIDIGAYPTARTYSAGLALTIH
ncbi:MAG: TonB-dependent receptor [Oscillospiraceae bacterium]|jgi:TonB-linked SusC/RagA family outer membrane protein|nr:TonB-dependent receptor [Oscillospiraceae bacterium]